MLLGIAGRNKSGARSSVDELPDDVPGYLRSRGVVVEMVEATEAAL